MYYYFIEGMTNAELGAKVRINHERYLEKIAMMTPQWQEEGAVHREMRKSNKITINEISELIGICTQVISKFEHGRPIRSRNVIAQSYRTAINYINLKRQMEVMNVNNESKTLLTVDQMCQLLNIGKNSAYKLLKTGEIQSFKIGRIWKIPKDSIDKYIAFYKK